MSKLWIAEYSGVATIDANGSVLALPQPPIAEQVVDYSGGVTPSLAFNPLTTLVEIHTDAICSVAFGLNPAATVNNMRMALGERRIVGVQQGQGHKVSAITAT